MKNKNGFVAISLIYSFFLVFLIVLLAIVSDYAHNRSLLSDIKKETQKYLNAQAEFNPVSIEKRAYTLGEEITFGEFLWQVMQDEEEYITVILANPLSETEISTALTNTTLPAVFEQNFVLMCLNEYNALTCNYQTPTAYTYYVWENSVVKKILDNWLANNAPLQKAISQGTVIPMEFIDGTTKLDGTIRTYSTYIRIPLKEETTDTNLWHLTLDSKNNGISYLKYGVDVVSAHTTKKQIKPIIKIKKATT